MRIDIHTHFVARFYADQARRGQAAGGTTVETIDGQEWLVHAEGFRYPLHREYWDVESKLADMDRLSIDVSVLSPTPSLFHYGLAPGPALEHCQGTNEALAEAVAQSGGRLYGMATLPMQAPEAAARELERAVRELGLVGAHVGTTAGRIPLDDVKFEPVLATAEKLGVALMLHPVLLDARREQFAPFYMNNLVGYMVETCVAASRLILTGCLDRYPHLAVVLVHGGGYLPYQVGRLDHGFEVRAETRANISAPPSGYLRRFHFDTITHAALPLRLLLEMVGYDRVMLGTDLPFDMSDKKFAEHIAALPVDEQARNAIYGENAARLFGLQAAPREVE